MRAVRGVALALALALAPGLAVAQGEAPFGDKVGGAFTNYNRAWPFVGSAGLLKDGAVAEAKALGFAAIVDLRTAEEGTADERAAAEAAGLTYINIPVAERAPTPEQVDRFAELMADPDLKPMLVHCASANRVGAMWALFRARQGVDPMVAVEEGRVLGLSPSREPAVRERLGLPAMSQ